MLKVAKLTVMAVRDDRRPSIEVLGAAGTPSIRIIGLTLCLWYGFLTWLVGLDLVHWQICMLDPQFANGQSLCIGRNIYMQQRVRPSDRVMLYVPSVA